MGPVDDFYVWGATLGFMFFRSSTTSIRNSESIQRAARFDRQQPLSSDNQ